jgi:hypothetical protein
MEDGDVKFETVCSYVHAHSIMEDGVYSQQ